MLQVEGICAGYGRTQVLWDLSLNVQEGEFVALVGANGAGKSTLLKTISGILRPSAGSMSFLDKPIEHMAPNKIVNLGLSHIPESRKLFTGMSIRENLEMGAYPSRSWKQRNDTLAQVFKLFPRLEERKNQMARTLSGGEQQMLAMGRGLMSLPKMCIVDEPSNGLAPLMVAEIFQILKSLHNEGITILLVEQNVRQTLSAADRAYVLENGHMVLEGACSFLRETDHIRKAYLAL
jgi:branched-chain amino acid transport system ATP-binding protein